MNPFIRAEAESLGFIDSGKGWWWCGWCTYTSVTLHGMHMHRELCVTRAWCHLIEKNL